MGTKIGHVGPGLIFLSFGLFLLTKGSFFRCSLSLRSSKLSLVLVGLLPTLGSMIMGGGEFLHSYFAGHMWWYVSHIQHYRFNFAIFSTSLIYLLHLFRILKGPFWGLMQAYSTLVLAITMSMHHQETISHTIAHQIAAFLFLSFFLSFSLEYLYSVFKYRASLQKEMPPTMRPKRSKLNPLYLQKEVYETMLPICSALLMILIGVWWIVMGIVMFNPDSFLKTSAFHHQDFAYYFNKKWMLLSIGITILIAISWSFCLKFLDTVSSWVQD